MEVMATTHARCPRDAVEWVLSESRKGTNAIGFVPGPRLRRDAARGRLVIVVNNDDMVAFLLRGALRRTVSITQLWTRRDARRVTHAAAAVEHVAAAAVLAGCTELHCRCAADLVAAECFWPALGFAEVERQRGGNARGRDVITFRRHLPTPLLFGEHAGDAAPPRR